MCREERTCEDACLCGSYSGLFSPVMPNLLTLLSIVARGTGCLVGYSYEDVIGPVDSFRVTHLTCDMIQTRRVVVTSSIGSSVSSNQRPAANKNRIVIFVHYCFVFIVLLFVCHFEVCPWSPFFHDVLEQFLSRRIRLIYISIYIFLIKIVY